MNHITKWNSLYLLQASLTLIIASCQLCFAGEPNIEKLINQLGSTSFKAREKATIDILSLGYKARPAVSLAIRSPDPEINLRAKEIWNTLRWLVASNITIESIQPLISSTNLPATSHGSMLTHRHVIHSLDIHYASSSVDTPAWKSFIEANRGASLLLLAEMQKSPAHLQAGKQAMVICMNVLSPDIAMETISQSSQDIRTDLIAMFSEAADMNYAITSNYCINVMTVLNHLGLHRKALEAGKTWWLRWPSDSIIDQYVIAVRKEKLEDKIWKQAESEFLAQRNSSTSFAILAFYAALAAEMEASRQFSAITRSAELTRNDPKFAPLLGARLLEMKLYDDIIYMTRKASDPMLLYFRAAAFKATGKEKEAEDEWLNMCKLIENAPNKASSAASYYRLAEYIENRGDKMAETLWQNLMKNSESNAAYHATSCFRLAAYAEKSKKPKEAASLYERGLSSSKLSGGSIFFSGAAPILPDFTGSAIPEGQPKPSFSEEDIRRHIERLRNAGGERADNKPE